MTRYVHGRRARRAGAALALGLAGLCAILAHAAFLRAEDGRHAAARVHLVRLVGTADLALSSSARWLRHPSQAEAGAAASDGPLSFDTDPAGSWIGPPRALLGEGMRSPRVTSTDPPERRR